MRHDVLCAKYGFDTDPGQDEWGYEPPVRPCDCSRFAEVRRDALAAAWDAVAALPKKNVNAGSYSQPPPLYVVNREQALAAIDALKGEQP